MAGRRQYFPLAAEHVGQGGVAPVRVQPPRVRVVLVVVVVVVMVVVVVVVAVVVMVVVVAVVIMGVGVVVRGMAAVVCLVLSCAVTGSVVVVTVAVIVREGELHDEQDWRENHRPDARERKAPLLQRLTDGAQAGKWNKFFVCSAKTPQQESCVWRV